MTTMAIFFFAAWSYAARGGRLLHPDADARMVSGITRATSPAPPPTRWRRSSGSARRKASALLYGLIAVFYMLSNAFFGKAGE